MMTTTDKPPAGIPSAFNGKPLRWAWTYRTPDGKPIGHVARYDDGDGGKDVVPHFVPNGQGWKAGGPPEPKPLFGLDTLRDNDRAFVVEGEPCAAALHSLGLAAVTSLGGSKSPHKADWKPLQAFRRIYIVPDKDSPGEGYARAVVGILAGLAGHREVSVCRLPELPNKGDVVDWLRSRVLGWDGFTPIPREPGDDLQAELVDALDAVAEDPPVEWTQGPSVESEGDGWEMPVPLDGAEIPAWPDDVFPEPVQRFVDALAASTETPRELPAMMTLAVLAAAAQGKYRVRVKPDYFEPLALWTCCALLSGSRKTAVYQAATHPLAGWERTRREEMEPAIKQAESEAKTIRELVESLRRKARNAQNLEAAQREIVALESRIPEVPKAPRLWTEDVTPERLAGLMAENHECIGLFSDEGGMLDMMGGRYNNGIPNLDVYLKGHSGSSVSVERLNRPAINLYNPCLTIGITPQPDVIRALANKPTFRGRGLLARFLYALPPSNLGSRVLRTAPISDAIRESYDSTISAMLDAERIQDAEGRPCARILMLAQSAFDAWEQFACFVEGGMAEGGTFHHMPDWASKLTGVVPRIAAVLHVARHAHAQPWGLPVSLDDMLAAIRLGEVLAKHALMAFDLMGADPALDDARAVLRWIQREGKREFTQRDAHVAHKHRFARVSDLMPALDVLAERGYIRLRPRATGPKGGRPSDIFAVNPLLWTV